MSASDSTMQPDAVGEAVSAEFLASPEGRAIYDTTPVEIAPSIEDNAALAALLEPIIQWALSEGLKLLAEQLRQLIYEQGVEMRSRSDITVDPGADLQVWLGSADDQANLWINGQQAGTIGTGMSPVTFRVQPWLKPGRNMMMVECNNHGRGRFSVAYGFFMRGQKWLQPEHWVGDDQLASRRWFFIRNIWLQ